MEIIFGIGKSQVLTVKIPTCSTCMHAAFFMSVPHGPVKAQVCDENMKKTFISLYMNYSRDLLLIYIYIVYTNISITTYQLSSPHSLLTLIRFIDIIGNQ